MFEDTVELAENKLLLLYIFQKAGSPLSNTRITEIVLENSLLNYFHLQQYLSELVDSGLLDLNRMEKKQVYNLSAKGLSVLEYFAGRITDNKRVIIDSYLVANSESSQKDRKIIADYYLENENEYIVTCKIIEDSVTIIDMKINVNSNEGAKRICSKWEANASKVYSNIINMLNT